MTDDDRMGIARGAARAVSPRAQRDDMDDMVQDALIAVWRAEQRWNGEGRVQAWCYSKAKGAVIDGLRVRSGRGNGRTVGPRVTVVPFDPLRTVASPDNTEDAALARIEYDRVTAAVTALPPYQAAAVRAHREGRSTQATAAAYGVGPTAISQMRRVALAKIA